MSPVATAAPGVAERRASLVPWLTVLALAVLMAYVDGFVVTSTEGAVGAIGSNDSPFTGWLRDSTLALPVFLFAVYRTLAFRGRRHGAVLRRPRAVLATALIVVAVGSLVGVAEVAASGLANYELQAEQLRGTQSVHGHEPPVAGAADADPCAGLCASLDATAAVHVRAAEYASALVLAANVVLVGWVVAARRGRLDAVPLRRRGAGLPPAT
jgi:hypothetical protein